MSLPLLAALLAAQYPVAVPVLDPLKPCYVTVQTGADSFEAEPIAVGGSGFAPNAIVDIEVDDEIGVSGAQVRSDGVLAPGLIDSPFILSGERLFKIRVTERGEDGRTVTAEAYAATLAVRVTPKRARPDRIVRFRGSGFTRKKPVYAHYIRKGKLRRTVRLAKDTVGACGVFDERAPQFPFRPERGTWRVQIDQRRRLQEVGPLINLSIDVRRRAKRTG